MSEPGTLPSFLIVGAAKAGTTALYEYLADHPQVFMSPRKETNFFAQWDDRTSWYHPDFERRDVPIATPEQYRGLFAQARGARAVGEASPWYLLHPQAAERIRSLVPEARLIAVLRDPVDRAYSHFLHFRRDQKEPCADFGRALDEEISGKRDAWHPLWRYQQMGFYAEQLSRYFERFDPEQIRVYLHDDFRKDNRAVLRDVLCFIGADPDVGLGSERRDNVSGVPKSRALQRLLKRPHPLKAPLARLLPRRWRRRVRNAVERVNLDAPPPLAPELRARLREVYARDVEALERLLGRDLSAWR